MDKYMVQTRAQAKSSSTKLPEVQGAQKDLIPHIKPEKSVPSVHPTPHTCHLRPICHIPHTDQRRPTNALPPVPKPRIGQGRAGIRRKPKVALPIPKVIQTPTLPMSMPAQKTVLPLTEPVTQSQGSILPQHQVPTTPTPLIQPIPASITQPLEPRIDPRPVPPYHKLFIRPPPRPQDVIAVKDSKKDLQELDMDRKIEFEENSPHQEGIISEMYERPDKMFIQETPELKDLIDTSKLIQKFLPKQTDIHKILDIIKRKVLKGTHLPLTIKEIQAGDLTSPYFKDLYLYLAQNKLPNKKSAIQKVENLAERLILLDPLLFKLITTPDKEAALLAVPEICEDKIIKLYHTSLFAGHQGVVKTYLTVSDKFFIPGLGHYLRSYIKGCHTCQIVRTDKLPTRQLQTRIHLNYKPLSRLSMDLKVMPRSHKGHKFILCVIDEVTNYLITDPIFQAKSEEVGEALIENVISKYCIPDCIFMDQDSAFMSSLMNYLFNRFEIKVKTVSPYNHQSLQAEHEIKPLSNIIQKHLTEKGQMWLNYLPFTTFAYNTFNSPNLATFSPYELVFGRKPKLLLDIETDPVIKVVGSFREYYMLLGKRLQYLHKLLQEARTKRLALMNKDRDYFQYNSGDLVLHNFPINQPIENCLQENQNQLCQSTCSLQNC